MKNAERIGAEYKEMLELAEGLGKEVLGLLSQVEAGDWSCEVQVGGNLWVLNVVEEREGVYVPGRAEPTSHVVYTHLNGFGMELEVNGVRETLKLYCAENHSDRRLSFKDVLDVLSWLVRGEDERESSGPESGSVFKILGYQNSMDFLKRRAPKRVEELRAMVRDFDNGHFDNGPNWPYRSVLESFLGRPVTEVETTEYVEGAHRAFYDWEGEFCAPTPATTPTDPPSEEGKMSERIAVSEVHLVEELENIEKNRPMFPGDTISHKTANECVRRGYARRNPDGSLSATVSGGAYLHSPFVQAHKALPLVEGYRDELKRILQDVLRVFGPVVRGDAGSMTEVMLQGPGLLERISEALSPPNEEEHPELPND